MKTKLTASLLKSAVSGATKREVVNNYGSKPGFPQDDAAVDTLLETLESLLPPNISEGKKKVYIKYLCKGLYGMTPPDWVLEEDNPRVQATLLAFETAIKDHRLEGQKANIDAYQSLADVMDASTEKKVKEDTLGFDLSCLPTSAEVGGQPGNPKESVAKGAKIIVQDGEWTVYKIKGGDPKGKEAGSWLGCNKWWDVHWCIGRDYSGTAWEGRPYMADDFYFFAKDHRPVYAMSTYQEKVDLYNPADAVIWSTSMKNEGSYPSLEAAAAESGSELSLSDLTSLPSELVPVLRKVVKVDKRLGSLIPAKQLAKGMSTEILDKILAETPTEELVKDLNNNTGYRSINVTKGLLGQCVSKYNKQGLRDFNGYWDQFNDQLMTAYIEALAGAGWKELPPSLEDYFCKEAENFQF